MTLWYNAGNPYRLDGHRIWRPAATSSSRAAAAAHVGALQGRLENRRAAVLRLRRRAALHDLRRRRSRGKLLHETAIELPGPRLPHDIGFTENYAILHDLPFFHDMDVLRKHHLRVLTFHRDIPTRFGIAAALRQVGQQPRWFDCEPCYILHVTNCWEEGDWVVMDGCRSTNPMPQARAGDEGELAHMLAYMRLEANNYRWRFNLRTGEVREGDIDDLNTEFNKSNPLFHGVARAATPTTSAFPWMPRAGTRCALPAWSSTTTTPASTQHWDYGDGVFGSEAVFAPAPAPASTAERTTATSSPWSRTATAGNPTAWSSTPATSAPGPSPACACPSAFPRAFTPPGRTGAGVGIFDARKLHCPGPRRNRRQVVPVDHPGGVLGHQQLQRHARGYRCVARCAGGSPALAAADRLPAPGPGQEHLSPDPQGP
jgi:hypothetical protein